MTNNRCGLQPAFCVAAGREGLDGLTDDAPRRCFADDLTAGFSDCFVQDDDWGRLLNEDEVFKRIEHLGFERLTTGLLPVAEQIALFSEAQIAARPHRAGLTNRCS